MLLPRLLRSKSPRKVHCDLEVLRQAVRLLRDGSDVDDIPKGAAAEAPRVVVAVAFLI